MPGAIAGDVAGSVYADTQAAIAGGIAEAFLGGLPDSLAIPAPAALPDDLRLVVDAFRVRFCWSGAA